MNNEFYEINKDILNNKEFNKLKNIKHHGITRYDHSLRVASYTYKVTKKLHLNYVEATRAALLHDFFTDEVLEENCFTRLIKHPIYALENAIKYFDISDMQKDIIVTHMFPISLRIPKYLESWIVDILDDIAAIYEKFYSFSLRPIRSNVFTFTFLVLINFFKFYS